MTALDAVAGPLAEKMIRQFGGAIAYIAQSDSVPPVETSYAMKGIIGAYNARDIGGTIETGDAKITISGRTWDSFKYGRPPRANDFIAIGMATFSVVSVSASYSGDAVATYDLQVR